MYTASGVQAYSYLRSWYSTCNATSAVNPPTCDQAPPQLQLKQELTISFKDLSVAGSLDNSEDIGATIDNLGYVFHDAIKLDLGHWTRGNVGLHSLP